MKNSRKTLLVGATLAVVSLSSFTLMMRRPSPVAQPNSSGLAAPKSNIVKPFNLAKLVDESDVIAVGQILEVSNDQPNQPEMFHPYEATVRVDNLIKGSAPSNFKIKLVKRASDAIKGRRIARSLYAMFFLKQQSSESYLLTDSGVEALVATNRVLVKKGDALERVIDVLSEVLRSNSSASDLAEAIAALASVNSPPANDGLHLVLNNSNEDLKLEAEVALLRHGDVSILPLVEGDLLKQPDSGNAAKIGKLSFAIQLGVRDPTSIPVLTHLLTSPNAEVRRAAAHGLRETHAPPAVTPLATVLNDTDQMVRYDAVLGLSEITGDRSHAPSVDAFKRDEKKYVAYWQAKF